MAKLKLGDPKLAAFKAERLAVYRERAATAIFNEHHTPQEGLLDALAFIAWQLEAGGVPSLLPIMQRTYRVLCNRVTDDALRIDRAMSNLTSAINDSAVPTTMELIEKIEAKGVTIDGLNNVLNILADVAREMAAFPRQNTKQGNTQKPRSSWVLQSWKCLSASSIGMKPAARVIAMTFDGEIDDYENIYQTIRNAGVKVKK